MAAITGLSAFGVPRAVNASYAGRVPFVPVVPPLVVSARHSRVDVVDRVAGVPVPVRTAAKVPVIRRGPNGVPVN